MTIQYDKFYITEKPIMDVSNDDNIERAIANSFTEKIVISLKMFDKYEDLRVTGVVERIDENGKRIMVDGEWFRMSDIIGTNS